MLGYMNLPCQVLHNLNNCKDCIDDDDLREVFSSLVGKRNPRPTQQFDTKGLENLDNTLYSLLSKGCGYAVIVAHKIWFVHSYNLSIQDATKVEMHINATHPTLKATVVPDEAALFMQGWEIESVSFTKGKLIILPIAGRRHVVSINMDDLDSHIRNENYLWNELGLRNSTLDKLQQNFTCIGCNKVEQVPATWDYCSSYLCDSCTQEMLGSNEESTPMTDEELKHLVNKQQEIADYGHDLPFELYSR
jgi:hypothetical protein